MGCDVYQCSACVLALSFRDTIARRFSIHDADEERHMSINGLATVPEVSKMITAGRILLLAGDESLLSKLPAGNWIGGTAVKFMTAAGGITDTQNIFYTDITEYAPTVEIQSLSMQELSIIGKGQHTNGFTVLIVPGLSDIHETFAKEVHCYEGASDRTLIGWITSVDTADIGRRTPKSFAGSGISEDNKAAIMYVTLPDSLSARLNIINLFSPNNGPIIEFNEEGFSSNDLCLINGKAVNLAAYILENKLDTKLPLVADYDGTLVNVSIQSVDAQKGSVRFYGPVFRYVKYRFAYPVPDYIKEFNHVMEKTHVGDVAFSCNCILNYLYGELEGKSTAPFFGPITFGEITSVLLNQTLAYLAIHKVVQQR